MLVVLNFPVPEDRRVWLQATAAAEAGHDVTVVSPALRGHGPGREALDGVDIRYVRAFEGRGPVSAVVEAAHGSVRAMREVGRLRLRQGDLLQVCTPPDSLSPLLARCRSRGVITVYDQHDVVPLLAATKATQRPLVPLHTRLESRTVRAASVVLTAGEVQADRLRRLYGVRPVVIRTAAADVVHRHKAPSDPRVLGYLGVMGSQDGVAGLIAAMGVLRDRGINDVVLRLAGDGPELPALQRLVRERGLAGRVDFLGWLASAALSAFMEDIDGLVVPDPVNPFNDSCPMLKVSHALAHGLPIVMTPLAENMAITGGTGFIAADERPEHLADAIQRWRTSSAAERTEVGSALRCRYDDVLAWPKHRDIYLTILERGASVG